MTASRRGTRGSKRATAEVEPRIDAEPETVAAIPEPIVAEEKPALPETRPRRGSLASAASVQPVLAPAEPAVIPPAQPAQQPNPPQPTLILPLHSQIAHPQPPMTPSRKAAVSSRRVSNSIFQKTLKTNQTIGTASEKSSLNFEAKKSLFEGVGGGGGAKNPLLLVDSDSSNADFTPSRSEAVKARRVTGARDKIRALEEALGLEKKKAGMEKEAVDTSKQAVVVNTRRAASARVKNVIAGIETSCVMEPIAPLDLEHVEPKPKKEEVKAVKSSPRRRSKAAVVPVTGALDTIEEPTAATAAVSANADFSASSAVDASSSGLQSMGTPIASLPKTFNFNFAKANPATKSLFQAPHHGCSSPLKNSIIATRDIDEDDDDEYEDIPEVKNTETRVESSVMIAPIVPAIAASAEPPMLSETPATPPPVSKTTSATTPRSTRKKTSLNTTTVAAATTTTLSADISGQEQQQAHDKLAQYTKYSVSMLPNSDKFNFTADAKTPPPASTVTGKRGRNSSVVVSTAVAPVAIDPASRQHYEETPGRGEGGKKKRMRISVPDDDESVDYSNNSKKRAASVKTIHKSGSIGKDVVVPTERVVEEWSEPSRSSSPPAKRNYIEVGGGDDEDEENGDDMAERQPVGSWLFSGIKRLGQTIGILEL
ncbi:hypothetical protein BDR26DRAFT_917984 [Obelidium mucronatum]|nr:hypothetical protein BDR26DRAFT_917984 [Obelidium mucronatum]